MSDKKTAIIIGAGPAGLTAACELAARTGIRPVIFERDSIVGGISRTVNYKGNRIDIGGHRFFSKSDLITRWWESVFPVQCAPAKDDLLLNRTIYPGASGACLADPEKTDAVLLVRPRLSRILYKRKFFDYPVSLKARTLLNIGLVDSVKIGLSYIKASVFPIKEEKSLEDFFINRFGRELYETFFKDYTEKVWGIPCSRIQADWGAQRVKGLSISRAILHALKKPFSSGASLAQKNVETTLIEKFMYPKYGPGQLWEAVADRVTSSGGEIYFRHTVCGIRLEGGKVVSVSVRNDDTGAVSEHKADYFFSTMPVKDLIAAMPASSVPDNVREVAAGLAYRDFVTAGILVKKLKVKNESGITTLNGLVPDTWIYVQERDVLAGRLQIFNNWSPYLVKDDGTVWLGVEYFCAEGGEFWNRPDGDIISFAVRELEKINFISAEDFLDGTVVRSVKTYPAYFGTYDRFDEVRAFTDGISNMFLVGRNGMHRYNNQDHSMLTAITAVDNIVSGRAGKDNIWSVNTEQEYHEER